VSNRLRIFTLVLGAAALAGVTYGVARRGLQRRAVPPLAAQALARSALGAPPVADAADARPLAAPDWQTLGEQTPRDSTPDSLDLAMNLSGIFDGQSAAGRALTARPNDHVPPPTSPDDEVASADDLGVAWLMQATQAGHSARGSDLAPEIENLAYPEEADDDAPDPNETDGAGDRDDQADFADTPRVRV